MAIQNLAARARAAGKSFAESAEQTVRAIETSNNISVQGIANSVEGSIDQISGAVQNEIANIKGVADMLANPGDLLANALDKKVSGLFGAGFGVSLGLPASNELEVFASYNYVLTFGCLSNLELNFPDNTYRVRSPQVIIAKSGGGAGASKATTAYETNGRVEYFIDNLSVESLIVPNGKTRTTNATSLSFEIYEPYSMGLFLQTLQVAAIRAGHKNYLEAPFIITVDFKGFDDEGRQINVPTARRMFPLKLVDVTFDVNEGGSRYAVEAIPYNEIAYSDVVQTTKTDITVSGKTVAEVLQSGGKSLTTVMNTKLLEAQEADQVKVADQYVIMFPTEDSSAAENLLGAVQDTEGATTESELDSGAEGVQKELTEDQKQKLFETITGIQNGQLPADFDAEIQKILGIVIKRSDFGEAIKDFAEKDENTNKIGGGKITKSFLDSGQQPFGLPKFTEVEDKPGVFARGKVQISDEDRTITFKKGSRIQDIIEEIVLLSDYGRQLAFAEPDKNGMIDWFRIEVNVYNITDDEQVAQTGRSARVYVFRILPFKVHLSKLTSSSEPAPGIENLKKQAIKEYNYIYTGKNKDIVNFEIKFDAAFFTAISSDIGSLGKDNKTGTSSKLAAGEDPVAAKVRDGNNSTASAQGQSKVEQSPNITNTNVGGPQVSTETQIARQFNNALMNSPVDLVSIDFSILGDPYYIADSGMGNYSAGSTALMNLTKNGSMDYQSGEVDIAMNFRTPIDYNEDGSMYFPGGGTKPVGAFSGLYQVITCRNNFRGGVFTQDLSCIRRRNQDIGIEATGSNVNIFEEGSVENIPGGLVNSVLSGVPEINVDDVNNVINDAVEAIKTSSLGGTGGISSASATTAVKTSTGSIVRSSNGKPVTNNGNPVRSA